MRPSGRNPSPHRFAVERNMHRLSSLRALGQDIVHRLFELGQEEGLREDATEGCFMGRLRFGQPEQVGQERCTQLDPLGDAM